ncbi:hypothetical protein TNCV_3398291 [Trichonephila clavipes]|nr:hypothetical protein TNCV_3398291 [Trichonephila clavipes]
MEFKKRICQSKYYSEEVAKCLLEGILEEKREIKKFEERIQAREFELERLRAQLRNKINENEYKAGNRINNLANVCYLSENRTTEVSEPVTERKTRGRSPALDGEKGKGPALDRESMRGELWLEWTGRER